MIFLPFNFASLSGTLASTNITGLLHSSCETNFLSSIFTKDDNDGFTVIAAVLMTVIATTTLICRWHYRTYDAMKGNDNHNSNNGALPLNTECKDASQFTKAKNQALYKELPFEDKHDFDLVKKGLIDKEECLIIKDSNDNVIWDIDSFEKMIANNAEQRNVAPETVNPSLWRQMQLLSHHGLYHVCDNIYQVRGYDMAVMTIIKSQTGYIVIDPLSCTEAAKAAMDLVYKNFGSDRSVKAVIYTHAHVDHFGGVKGIITNDKEVAEGRIQVYAPEGFMEHFQNENVIAANCMGRRAQYHCNMLLPISPKGSVGMGLGMASSTGTLSIIPPTELIKGPYETRIIDGIEMEFIDTPGAEACEEMMIWFPQTKALCVAEEANATMHNLYTLRGAEVRDGLLWSHWLSEALKKYDSKFDVIFGSHFWPHWGQKECMTFLEKQRDLYKFMHDQTLRMVNQGYVSEEIAEEIQLPSSLSKEEFYNRGYYGTLKHNAKAQYQKYIGWFDGNPANLDPLPPVQTSRKMIKCMGGSQNVLIEARKAFNEGEYRWVAQLVNNIVFAEPNNREAKLLQADALEQLGYQSESGIWRGFYLTGAQELRHGVQKHIKTLEAGDDTYKTLTPNVVFKDMMIHLNGLKASKLGKELNLNFDFRNSEGKSEYDHGLWQVRVNRHGVMHYEEIKDSSNANGKDYINDKEHQDASVTVRTTLYDLSMILTKKVNVWTIIKERTVQIEGNPMTLVNFVMLLEEYNKWFNIVTP